MPWIAEIRLSPKFEKQALEARPNFVQLHINFKRIRRHQSGVKAVSTFPSLDVQKPDFFFFLKHLVSHIFLLSRVFYENHNSKVWESFKLASIGAKKVKNLPIHGTKIRLSPKFYDYSKWTFIVQSFVKSQTLTQNCSTILSWTVH